MNSAKANQAQFLFICGSLDVATFSVVSFSGSDTISKPYEFTITLRSQNSNIDSADILNKPATLFMFRDGEFFPYSGAIVDFNYVETTTDFSLYSVKLAPQLWLLSLNVQTRIFQKMTVTDIIKKVLTDANLSNYFTLDTGGSYPQREFVVQHKESDLHFISRLMEDVGIWFFFKELPLLQDEIEGVSSESLVMSDKSDSFVSIAGESEIVFKDQSGLYQHDSNNQLEYCNKLSVHKKVTAQNVYIKNYNYRTPEVAITAQKQIDNGTIGSHYEYGGHFKDSSAAQKSAEHIAKQIASGAITLSGEGNCRGFKAGMRFTLKEHDRDECNDTYLITNLTHTGANASVAGGDKQTTYTNNFSLLPSNRISLYAPPKEHTLQTQNGIITAPIEADGTDYAGIDERGRYKVRLPYDISDSKKNAASKYIRLAQPYSGANYGIHFPSHEGTEMVLAYIDGDPDKPMGIGTVPNANTTSPVVSTNKEQNVIRTAGKNEMVFDDTKDKQKIRLTTAKTNTIILDDENKLITVQTTDGNKLIIDDKNNVTSLNAKKHNLTMSYKSGSEGITLTSEKGHIIKIDDKGKKVTIQTSAGHTMQMDDDGKKIVLTDCKGKNSVTLDGSNGLILDSKGKISITATQDVMIKGANISLEAASGKLNIKAAQDVVLSGMNIDAKGSVGIKAKGLNVELAADAAMKIKGGAQTDVGSSAMTTVCGSGMLTLKGGVVMIN